MTIYCVYFHYPNEEDVVCGYFDDYNVAKEQMNLLRESFALKEKITGCEIPSYIDIEEYNLNDTSFINGYLDNHKSAIEMYKKRIRHIAAIMDVDYE